VNALINEIEICVRLGTVNLHRRQVSTYAVTKYSYFLAYFSDYSSVYHHVAWIFHYLVDRKVASMLNLLYHNLIDVQDHLHK